MNVDIDPLTLWKAQAEAIILQCCRKAGMEDVAKNILIIFSNRKRTTMGTAWTHYGKHETHPSHIRRGKSRIKNPLHALNGCNRGGVIFFATKLFERADQSECHDIIIHEVAHILTNLKYGKSQGHNAAWKRMMVRLGGEPTRCHTVSTKGLRRRQKRFNLCCPCGWSCSVSASHRTKAANAIAQGKKRYWCPECKRHFKAAEFRNAPEV